ncbi:gamma-synuclein-like [Arapaima gigas]
MASFLKKALGSKADTYIDQAVDQVAVITKDKVKTAMRNDPNGKGGNHSSKIPEGSSSAQKKPAQAEQSEDKGAGGNGDITDDLMAIAGELANKN